MVNERNFQKELDQRIREILKKGEAPSLFLHSCCAPCSSYVMEYLSEFFRITVFYYNPNIFPDQEYEERVREQERLIGELNGAAVRGEDGTFSQGDGRRFYPIKFLAGEYRPEIFYETVKGLEKEPEGGARCTECFRLRLREAARLGKDGGFDFFTTTLSISPLKDAKRLNSIGEEEGAKTGIAYLNSDFKKKNGYQRSVELSADHGLYRQNYCGCVFSKARLDRG